MPDDTPISVHDAKADLSRLLDRVEAGEEVVIARAGKPVAKLVPIPAARKRVPGAWKHLTPPPDSFFFDPLPEEELRLWEGTSEHDTTPY
jgi:prevent-host-death family protein